MSASSVRCERIEGGAVLHLVLARPKANILDAQMVAELRAAVADARREPRLRAVLIEGEGAHFSYGASVEEHLPARVASMLKGFHGLFRDLISLGRPLLAAVRGQCLGGGLELAAFCQRVHAAPSARLGQPEIQLGVFAPMASLILPRRIGQPAADDLLLSGRSVEASEALALRLVDAVAEDPRADALAWIRTHLLPKSAASLALATQAARHEFDGALLEHIDRLEGLYLDRLMALADPVEGLTAFIERRPAAWSHA